MGTPELTTWAPAARTTSINSNVTTTSYPQYRMELWHRCGVSTSTTDSREAIESMFRYIDGNNGTATETGKISFHDLAWLVEAKNENIFAEQLDQILHAVTPHDSDEFIIEEFYCFCLNSFGHLEEAVANETTVHNMTMDQMPVIETVAQKSEWV